MPAGRIIRMRKIAAGRSLSMWSPKRLRTAQRNPTPARPGGAARLHRQRLEGQARKGELALRTRAACEVEDIRSSETTGALGQGKQNSQGEGQNLDELGAARHVACCVIGRCILGFEPRSTNKLLRCIIRWG